MIDLSQRYVMRKQGRHRPGPPPVGDLELFCIRGNAYILGDRMDAGVRSARAREVDGTAQECLERAPKLARHGTLARLLRKARERGAVIADFEYQRTLKHLRVENAIFHAAPTIQ